LILQFRVCSSDLNFGADDSEIFDLSYAADLYNQEIFPTFQQEQSAAAGGGDDPA
jgi:hypothetical protein